MAFVTGQCFLKVHVFPYSRREGTPAFDFPDQIPEHEKEDRSHRMTAAVEAVRAEEATRMQGRIAEVLLETPLSATLFTGYTKQVPAGTGHSARIPYRGYCQSDTGLLGWKAQPCGTHSITVRHYHIK